MINDNCYIIQMTNNNNFEEYVRYSVRVALIVDAYFVDSDGMIGTVCECREMYLLAWKTLYSLLLQFVVSRLSSRISLGHSLVHMSGLSSGNILLLLGKFLFKNIN